MAAGQANVGEDDEVPDLVDTDVESDCEDEVIFALRNKSLSPWSWKFFELVRLKAGKVGGGAAVMMHKWLSLVATAFPGCLLNLTCHSLSIRSVGTLKTRPSIVL